MKKYTILFIITLCIGAKLFSQSTSLNNEIYVYQNIKPETVEPNSDWAFGASLSLGYGAFTQELKSKYRFQVPFEFIIDLYYKNIAVYGGLYLGWARTKKDIYYDSDSTLWDKKSSFNIILPSLSIGYLIANTVDYKIVPFAGLSFMNIGPSDGLLHELIDLDDLLDKEPAPTGIVFDKKIFYMVGVNFDVEGVRLRYAYNFPFYRESHDSVSGSLHYFTIGMHFYQNFKNAK